jgi:soluble lytic murein transglycosylase-like protein
MDQAGNLDLSDVTAKAPSSELERLSNDAFSGLVGAQKKFTLTPVRLAVGGLIFSLLAVSGAAFAVAYRLRESEKFAAETARASSAQLAALGEKAQALESEVNELQESLHANNTEDSLFLKIIILRKDIDPGLARTVAQSVYKYSELYGRDPNLALAIIEIESNFNPAATSSVGALGLMQVMPHWKKILAIKEDLRDPDTSIRYGLQILGFYHEMYRDLTMALTAYNRGPGPIDRALMKGQDPKNDYPGRVLEAYDRLKRMNVRQAGK